MNRTETRTVALALLAVVVVGVAAATISSSVPRSEPVGSDAETDGDGGQPSEEDDERVLPEIGFDFDYSPDGDPLNQREDDGGSGADGNQQGDGTALTPQSPTGVAALVGVVLLVGLAFLLRGRSSDDSDRDTDEDESETVAGVRRAAGAAADRIETDAHADPDNEVYRAWREMTTHLDVAVPRSSTPGEFAAAAVEAGLDREDVSELTAVFRAVRYGGRTPTDERERRAVEALRRIERREDIERREEDEEDESADRDEDSFREESP